jgi:LPXTG-motif cell wall-anchored protein
LSTFIHRADGSVGHAQLFVRIVIALTVALLSLPLMSTSAFAEGEADGTSSEQTTDPATDPPPTDPSLADPSPVEPAAEEPVAPPATKDPVPAPKDEPAAPTAEEPTTQAPAPEKGAGEEPAAEEPVKASTGKTVTTVTADADAAPTAGSDCAASFDQNTQEDRGGSWINGALNQNNSNYAEGDYVPQRVELTGLTTGPHTLTFSYDRTKNGKYAYDFVDHLGISGSAGASVSWDAATPNPPMPFAETVFVTITFKIVANDPSATLIWDGHIASELDYGPNTGAGSISGAPYHFSLTDMSCGNVGQQDNQLMADAVDFGKLTIVKDAQPNSAQDFSFTLDAPNDLDTAFNLDDDSDGTLPNSVTYNVPPGATTATEVNIPGGWTLTDITCTKAGTAVGTEVGSSVTVTLADDELVTCTFTNSRESSLEVDKYWVINGAPPVEEGSEPAHLGLGAQLTVNGHNQPWDTSITGFLAGASVTLNESVTFGNELCRWKDTEIQGLVTEDNGQTPANGALPYTDALGGGSNHYTITNTGKCDGRLTLEKKVVNGDASASAWTLSATRSGSGLQYESGPTGVRHRVTADSPYALGEDDADSRYEQYGPWTCTEYGTVTTLNGVQSVSVEAGRDATCTVKNATGELVLVKDVQNSFGDAVASDFTLTATGDEGTVEHVTGSEGGETIYVDPDESFALTESSLDGYNLASLTCDDGQDPASIEVDANETVTCTFVNVDTHFTLDKDVKILDGAGVGDGDGVAEPGEQLEYSLTVVNDSDGDLDDEVVTDNLADVLLYADMVSTDAELAGQGLSLSGSTLTLTFDLDAGDSLTVRYTVEIKDGAWGVTLHNVATPEPEGPGECIPPGDVPGDGEDDLTECTTDTPTPPVTDLPVQKIDEESGEVLEGATFELWSHQGGCEEIEIGTAEDLIGPDDELIATEVTGADGLSLFEDLQHGCYLLVETDAPEGYADPVVNAIEIQIGESNLVAGGQMITMVIGNFAEGLLGIVAKRQYELIDSEWVPSDGEIEYGEFVKYQVEVAATGPKNFHDVAVTDYVPGFNPDDEVSTLDGILDEASIACVGTIPCTTSYDPDTHLVTWDLGDVEPGAGETIGTIAEMVVRFPDRPAIVAPGVTITDSLWNVGYLRWIELAPGPITGEPGQAVEIPKSLTSNEVVIAATYSQPPEPIIDNNCKTNPDMKKCKKLPDTGAQAHLVQLAGLGALVLGLGLALVTRRRKEEEQA